MKLALHEPVSENIHAADIADSANVGTPTELANVGISGPAMDTEQSVSVGFPGPVSVGFPGPVRIVVPDPVPAGFSGTMITDKPIVMWNNRRGKNVAIIKKNNDEVP